MVECRDPSGEIVVVVEVDPGEAVSLAAGWRQMGFLVEMWPGLGSARRKVLEAANPPTDVAPSDYQRR